jgi:sulfite exporter TauE/SafE
VLIYSFGPIPSNQLFIAVGLTGMRLTPVVAAFMAGRLVSYTVSGLIVHRAASSIEAALTSSWRGVVPVLLQLLAFAGLFLFTLIDWRRVLHLPAARPPGKSDHPVGPRDAA